MIPIKLLHDRVLVSEEAEGERQSSGVGVGVGVGETVGVGVGTFPSEIFVMNASLLNESTA